MASCHPIIIRCSSTCDVVQPADITTPIQGPSKGNQSWLKNNGPQPTKLLVAGADGRAQRLSVVCHAQCHNPGCSPPAPPSCLVTPPHARGTLSLILTNQRALRSYTGGRSCLVCLCNPLHSPRQLPSCLHNLMPAAASVIFCDRRLLLPAAALTAAAATAAAAANSMTL
jgi:hypothetical protein